MRYLTTALALIACSSAALADAPSGSAVAVDGDTLNVDGVVVRVFGIDAPELDQPCLLEGESWSCGQDSREQLAALLANGTVTCLGDEHDSYGRLLATCHVGGFDINRTMVAEGWAVAYRSYSDAYVAEETRARAARQGIWRSQFDLPQSYRSRVRKLQPRL